MTIKDDEEYLSKGYVITFSEYGYEGVRTYYNIDTLNLLQNVIERQFRSIIIPNNLEVFFDDDPVPINGSQKIFKNTYNRMYIRPKSTGATLTNAPSSIQYSERLAKTTRAEYTTKVDIFPLLESNIVDTIYNVRINDEIYYPGITVVNIKKISVAQFYSEYDIVVLSLISNLNHAYHFTGPFVNFILNDNEFIKYICVQVSTGIVVIQHQPTPKYELVFYSNDGTNYDALNNTINKDFLAQIRAIKITNVAFHMITSTNKKMVFLNTVFYLPAYTLYDTDIDIKRSYFIKNNSEQLMPLFQQDTLTESKIVVPEPKQEQENTDSLKDEDTLKVTYIKIGTNVLFNISTLLYKPLKKNDYEIKLNGIGTFTEHKCTIGMNSLIGKFNTLTSILANSENIYITLFGDNKQYYLKPSTKKIIINFKIVYVCAQVSHIDYKFEYNNKKKVLKFYDNKHQLIYNHFDGIQSNMKNIQNVYFIDLHNVNVKLTNGYNQEFVFYSTVYFFPAYISNGPDDASLSINLTESQWSSTEYDNNKWYSFQEHETSQVQQVLEEAQVDIATQVSEQQNSQFLLSAEKIQDYSTPFESEIDSALLDYVEVLTQESSQVQLENAIVEIQQIPKSEIKGTRHMVGTVDVGTKGYVNIFTVIMYTETHFKGNAYYFKPGKDEIHNFTIKSILVPPRVVVTFFSDDDLGKEIITYNDSQEIISINPPMYVLIQASKHPCYLDNNEITVYKESENEQIHFFYSSKIAYIKAYIKSNNYVQLSNEYGRYDDYDTFTLEEIINLSVLRNLVYKFNEQLNEFIKDTNENGSPCAICDRFIQFCLEKILEIKQDIVQIQQYVTESTLSPALPIPSQTTTSEIDLSQTVQAGAFVSLNTTDIVQLTEALKVLNTSNGNGLHDIIERNITHSSESQNLTDIEIHVISNPDKTEEIKVGEFDVLLCDTTGTCKVLGSGIHKYFMDIKSVTLNNGVVLSIFGDSHLKTIKETTSIINIYTAIKFLIIQASTNPSFQVIPLNTERIARFYDVDNNLLYDHYDVNKRKVFDKTKISQIVIQNVYIEFVLFDNLHSDYHELDDDFEVKETITFYSKVFYLPAYFKPEMVEYYFKIVDSSVIHQYGSDTWRYYKNFYSQLIFESSPKLYSALVDNTQPIKTKLYASGPWMYEQGSNFYSVVTNLINFDLFWRKTKIKLAKWFEKFMNTVVDGLNTAYTWEMVIFQILFVVTIRFMFELFTHIVNGAVTKIQLINENIETIHQNDSVAENSSLVDEILAEILPDEVKLPEKSSNVQDTLTFQQVNAVTDSLQKSELPTISTDTMDKTEHEVTKFEQFSMFVLHEVCKSLEIPIIVGTSTTTSTTSMLYNVDQRWNNHKMMLDLIKINLRNINNKILSDIKTIKEIKFLHSPNEDVKGQTINQKYVAVNGTLKRIARLVLKDNDSLKLFSTDLQNLGQKVKAQKRIAQSNELEKELQNIGKNTRIPQDVIKSITQKRILKEQLEQDSQQPQIQSGPTFQDIQFTESKKEENIKKNSNSGWGWPKFWSTKESTHSFIVKDSVATNDKLFSYSSTESLLFPTEFSQHHSIIKNTEVPQNSYSFTELPTQLHSQEFDSFSFSDSPTQQLGYIYSVDFSNSPIPESLSYHFIPEDIQLKSEIQETETNEVSEPVPPTSVNEQKIPEEKINLVSLFEQGTFTTYFYSNFVITKTKEKGYIPINSNARFPHCNYMFTQYTILISDLKDRGYGNDYKRHITELYLNAHALLDNSKTINSIEIYNKHNQHRTHLDIDIVFLYADGTHKKLDEIGVQHPTQRFIYNINEKESNTFDFLIAQISRNNLGFCLSNEKHCCKFYNVYGELIFDYFQPDKEFNVTNNKMSIYQIELVNVILVMLQKGTEQQNVFYSHVFYFPMYVIGKITSKLENFDIEIYTSINRLEFKPNYFLSFIPLNFYKESFLQDTLNQINKKTKEKNNADAHVEESAPSSIQYSTTESKSSNLELNLFNTPVTDDDIQLHNHFNNAFSLVENSMTTTTLRSESSTEMKRYINLPEGSVSKELISSLKTSFNLQITSGGDLVDSNNNALDIDTLQKMLVSFNDPNSELISAIVTASKLGSDSFLSKHYSEIPVKEMYLKSFEITTKFSENNKYFKDLQLQYSDSDSLNDSVSKLMTYIEHGIMSHADVRIIKQSIEHFGTILHNVQVPVDEKALIIPLAGKLINNLSLHNKRLTLVISFLVSIAKQFGTDQVMDELSEQSRQTLLPLLPLQSSGELSFLKTNGLISTIGTEQKVLLSKLLNSENNLSTYSNEEKFSYLMMYLNEQAALSKQVEEDLYPLMDLFDKDYESIQLNGEVISSNDKTSLFKKEYVQGSYTFKLLLKNYDSPPLVNFENLLSDGIIQYLPPLLNFDKLLSDGIVQYLPLQLQLPIKTTTINNNQVKSRASEFLYRPTSKFSSSQNNTPRTDLLVQLIKLRVQKEAERLRQEEVEAQQQRKQAEAEAEAERQRKQEEAERQREQEDAEIERSVLRNLIRSFWIIFSIMVFTVLIGIILYRYYYDYFNNFSFVRLITRWRSG